MKIRWNEQTVRELEWIYAYIAEDKPHAAAGVVAAIVDTAYRLEQFPMLGRAGRFEGTRELVVPGLPYIISYQIAGEDVLIDSVIHTSRRWPES